MKKIFYRITLIIIHAIGLLCLAPSLFAQTIHGFGESPEGPSHPLNPKLGQPRILADTMRIKEYVGIVDPPYPLTVSIKKFGIVKFI